jgi:hypothetical protein
MKTLAFIILCSLYAPILAFGGDWKIIEKVHYDWKGDKNPYDFVLRAPDVLDGGGDYTQLQIMLNGKVLYEVNDDDGLAKISVALTSERKKLCNKNILKSKYLMMISGIKGNSKYPLLFLFGWPYASDPGSLHVVALGNDSIPKEILNLKNFALDSFAELDKKSTLELIGNPCMSEVWGPENSFLSYSPYHVYRFGPLPTSPMTLDLKLTESYNKKKYYGWAGPACSEETVVVLHPPGGGRPLIMEAKKAQSIMRKK